MVLLLHGSSSSHPSSQSALPSQSQSFVMQILEFGHKTSPETQVDGKEFSVVSAGLGDMSVVLLFDESLVDEVCPWSKKVNTHKLLHVKI